MNISINLSAVSVFVLFGVLQGLILSVFFLFKRASNIQANRFQGLLLAALSLCILEQFLNMTGIIVKVLFLTNTTEPLNLVIGPFLYLYIKRSLNHSGSKKELFHFLLPMLYFFYMCLDYVQPNEFKYNSFVNSYHPGWSLLEAETTISSDPFNIKRYLNLVTALQILFYIILSLIAISKLAEKEGNKLLQTRDKVLTTLRNMVVHISAIVLIFIVVKLNFTADLGDYFIGIYVAILTFLTTFRVMNDSAYFERSASFLDVGIPKYTKSSLNETGKQRILKGIIYEFETKGYFEDNLASLSALANRLGESPHHVSQVINEKLNKNFFELLAHYRIEKAKRILSSPESLKYTIEEVSEMVGYNSKTAFNNAFRKITGITPSEFRSR